MHAALEEAQEMIPNLMSLLPTCIYVQRVRTAMHACDMPANCSLLWHLAPDETIMNGTQSCNRKANMSTVSQGSVHDY